MEDTRLLLNGALLKRISSSLKRRKCTKGPKGGPKLDLDETSRSLDAAAAPRHRCWPSCCGGSSARSPSSRRRPTSRRRRTRRATTRTRPASWPACGARASTWRRRTSRAPSRARASSGSCACGTRARDTSASSWRACRPAECAAPTSSGSGGGKCLPLPLHTHDYFL